MKLLILGGTVFLGRHLVEAALLGNHEVTLFNRGQHFPELFPQVEKLRGDRNNDLNALAGRYWDAVIDTCGYVPRVVRQSAELLADQADHYTFISSLSVYDNFRQPGIDETATVGTLGDPDTEEVSGETYGPLKALCEQAAESAMPGRVLNIRPGLIVGPHDPTDRFTYWPVRVAAGGDVLAPSRADYPTEYIDVRDLAAWLIQMASIQTTGVYNATGPAVTLGAILETSQQLSGRDARIHWVTESFLLEKGIEPWQDLPLWVTDAPDMAGFAHFNISKAKGAGLDFRPLYVTVRDTLTWAQTRPSDYQWRAGLTRDREAELLRDWSAVSE